MSSAEPGWYADATTPALIRWWDGAAWTDNTQPNPAGAAPPVIETTPAPPVIEATPASGSLDYPPPAFSSPEFASPSTGSPSTDSPLPANPPPSPSSGRRAAVSMPVSEPVRVVPPTSGSIPVADFPGLDTPLPSAKPAAGPEPLAVPTALATPPQPAAPSAAGALGLGAFAFAPLATAAPQPASASTPWTSSSAFAQPGSAAGLASVEYEPMTRSWGSARPASALRTVTGVTTGGSWMLALAPLVHLGLVALAWWLTEGATTTLTTAVVTGIAVAGVLWVVIGVVTDYRRLGVLGHRFRPSVAWILLGPFFYLMVRAIHVYRTARSGTAPTWVYVVFALIVGAALGLASLVLPREASTAELRTVETTIQSELAAQGIEYDVVCPSTAPANLGSSFVCTAYDEVGPAAVLRVMVTGVPGAFTYAFE